ncbi:MAG: ATP-binding protein [Anaerolineae bacterium]|nr:ATP-binding protein [Anaerolineae bacterium]
MMAQLIERSLMIPARLDQLQRASAFVSEIAATIGFCGLQLCHVELAVDEACANIVEHAYAHKPGGRIHIHVHAEPGHRIVITLIDTGQPFDPQAVAVYDPSTGVDDARPGGFGLFLIQRAMDEVQFEFNVKGVGLGQPKRFNRLTMVKYL